MTFIPAHQPARRSQRSRIMICTGTVATTAALLAGGLTAAPANALSDPGAAHDLFIEAPQVPYAPVEHGFIPKDGQNANAIRHDFLAATLIREHAQMPSLDDWDEYEDAKLADEAFVITQAQNRRAEEQARKDAEERARIKSEEEKKQQEDAKIKEQAQQQAVTKAKAEVIAKAKAEALEAAKKATSAAASQASEDTKSHAATSGNNKTETPQQDAATQDSGATAAGTTAPTQTDKDVSKEAQAQGEAKGKAIGTCISEHLEKVNKAEQEKAEKEKKQAEEEEANRVEAPKSAGWADGLTNRIDMDALSVDVEAEKKKQEKANADPAEQARNDVEEAVKLCSAQVNATMRFDSVFGKQNTSGTLTGTTGTSLFNSGTSQGFDQDEWLKMLAALPEGDRSMVSKPKSTGDTGVNSYAFGNCTSYAYERRKALNMPIGSHFGNGGQWANSARKLGYSVSNLPTYGAVAVFGPGQVGADGYYGHVAVVEQVRQDGSVLISEMNVKGLNVVSTRVLTPAQAASIEYIH
ncbi:CHAP domain-containing protein [Bifidobacterium gallicum]|nr:CHAP domain-containing protein [Bifidobacterium gallicum]KFI57652.1 N-acetylmuramoyl-L-alanine amidase, family 4 [Bifidobacterium gallicum DSM 20093 = LMG 11596]